jgi:hypothetical protein
MNDAVDLDPLGQIGGGAIPFLLHLLLHADATDGARRGAIDVIQGRACAGLVCHDGDGAAAARLMTRGLNCLLDANDEQHETDAKV